MIEKPWNEIKTMISGASPEEVFDHIVIRGVSTDSRAIEAGSLFIPLTGEKFDGHAYVEDAIAAGAAGALWQNDHPEPPHGIPLIFVDSTLLALQSLAKAYREQLKVRIIGITGSNGKTTTKDMTSSILSTTYKVMKTKGNLNNHIGLALTLLSLEEDTEMAVIEMGMSGRGEIELLSRLAAPEAAIITNIGESHLQQLGSREEIAKAKLEILCGMPSDGLLIYNGDEPLIEQALEASRASRRCLPEGLKTFRFGFSPGNDFFPIGIMLDSEQFCTYFALNTAGSETYYIPFLGRHNVINALAAIAVSKYMGVNEANIKRGLKEATSTGMRIEVVKGANGLTILNDAYNASPTSMRAAIALLHEMKGYRRKIVVLGDMLELGGNEDLFHRQIGEVLDPEQIDYVFTYGKLTHWIAEEAASRFRPGTIIEAGDKALLAERIAELASPQDIVLFKGSRGMRLEEVVERLRKLEV